MNTINNLDWGAIIGIAGSIATIWAFYFTVKSVTISSNKNDFEQWTYLINNLEKIRYGDKISQEKLIKSISFLKKKSFAEAYLITKFSLHKNINLFELRNFLYLRKKKYMKYKYEDGVVKLNLTEKSWEEYSVILFETAKGFNNFSWGLFFTIHVYILYTILFYNKDIIPIKSGEINLIGVIYIIFLCCTEIFMLIKIDIRKSIEEFCKKYN